jgi:hypothetical protein
MKKKKRYNFSKQAYLTLSNLIDKGWFGRKLNEFGQENE